MGDSQHTPTNWKAFLGYGTGDFALNLFWQSTGFYLFFFYANVAGLPNTVIGTILLIGSIWDAITDPTMGYVAERTKSKWGPYRPYLMFGATPLALSFFLLFTHVEITNDTWKAIYYLSILLMFRTCYTVVSIPYSALGARVTRNSNLRTKLAGIRMYFGFLGGVCISLFAKYLQENYSDIDAFAYLGSSAAFISVFILILCSKATQESSSPINEIETKAGALESLSSVFHNRPFLLLIGGIVLVTVATTIIGQTSLFYFETQFSDRNIGNTAIIIITASPLVSIPLWTALALKIGKRNAWILGGFIAMMGLTLLYLDSTKSPTLALMEITLIAVGLSSYAVLFWSMLPDTMEYGEYQSNVHSESLLIGLASSFQKIAIGLSAFTLGFLLDLVDFEAGTEHTVDTILGVKYIYTLVPFAALLCASALIFLYPITSKLHGEIIESLRKKMK